MKPLVSIITPVYNAMPYLTAYLDSVENQTYAPLELILVDDGSTDDSLAVLTERAATLKEKGIAVQVLSQNHAGQAAAVNLALRRVRGELLTWCDADDYWTNDSVEKKAECLLAHPELHIVRSNGVIQDETENPITYRERENQPFISDIFDDLFRERVLELAGRFMVRTEALFACYPDRHIPVSNVEQNLQILLPVASRSQCAYLEEELHVYCRRSSGHSSQKRSFTETMKRIEEVKQLYLSILPYCECDQAYYRQEVENMTAASKKKLMQTTVMRVRKGTGKE
ncbi:glycosyltransferase family 2 protein [Cohnella cellulosilytica]|uniref:Glycosyltransferase family 2 protein n=1 Tax=Cohnella cellulosilytica TaxID=986710 RepID=A0ABW2FEX6_9BACL